MLLDEMLDDRLVKDALKLVNDELMELELKDVGVLGDAELENTSLWATEEEPSTPVTAALPMQKSRNCWNAGAT